jgi:hypothetical protein
MSSPATRLRWSARLALAATALSVAGCQNYAARRDTIAFHAGEAAAYNKAVHTIDPWPAAAARADIPLDGPRAVRAIERYEQGAPAAANGANGGTSMPAPGASATGGP